MGWQGYDNEGCMPGDRERFLRLREGMRSRSQPSPSYTLKEIEALGLQYAKEAYADDDDLTGELELSRFLAWLAKREREGQDGER